MTKDQFKSLKYLDRICASIAMPMNDPSFCQRRGQNDFAIQYNTHTDDGFHCRGMLELSYLQRARHAATPNLIGTFRTLVRSRAQGTPSP